MYVGVDPPKLAKLGDAEARAGSIGSKPLPQDADVLVEDRTEAHTCFTEAVQLQVRQTARESYAKMHEVRFAWGGVDRNEGLEKTNVPLCCLAR